jgi:transcriptional regulator with GAF, ATPase, and Fis domain
MVWDDELGEAGTDGAVRQMVRDLDRVFAVSDELGDVFDGFTRCLEQVYDISRGFLAVRESDYTRFLALATWQHGRERRNLSLRLPTDGSLLEKVAEDGQMYSDGFAELCGGNMVERRLLGDSARSFVLRPLKYEAHVVGILGYSSNDPDAFAAFDERLLAPFLDRFAERIALRQTVQHHPVE